MEVSAPQTNPFGGIFNSAISLFLIMLVFVAIIVVYTVNARNEAKKAYESALLRYSKTPTDLALRQAAIEAGRRYSNLTRNNYGLRSFDEAGIKNDLDTIESAIREGRHPSTKTPEPPRPAVADRLKTLDGLMSEGLISEEEYSERRTGILNEI